MARILYPVTMAWTLAISALAQYAMSARSSASIFIVNADPQPLVGSIVRLNGATTTYQIRCSDTEECGFPDPFTYIKDGTSSIQYAVGIQASTVECSVEGTASATCTASGDVPPEETGAPAQPFDMTTTLSADEITYTQIPIVGAAVAPPTGLSAAATSTSLSNEPVSQTGSISSQSSPSSDQASTTSNTAGAMSLYRSSMMALVGAAVLAAVLI